MRSWPAVLMILLVAPAAHADRDPLSGAPLPPGPQRVASPITDHFYLGANFYYPRLRTTIQADPTLPPGSGTILSAEKNLGMPSRLALGQVEAMVRARERHKLRVNYAEYDRSGSVLPTNPIVFGNQTFSCIPACQQLSSLLDWRMMTFTYTYSFYRSDRLEIGSGVAIYTLDLHAQLSVSATSQQQTESASGAVPALPLDLTWRVSKRFSFAAHGAYFKANTHDNSGWVSDRHLDGQYRWNPNLTTGIGYTSTRMSLTRTGGSSSPGWLNSSVGGLEAFVRFSF